MATTTKTTGQSKTQAQPQASAELAKQEPGTVAKTEQPQVPEPQPEPQPRSLPVAQGDLGAGRIVYYRPSLTLPDGTVIDCVHEQWGHSTAKTAAKCLRAMAAEHGVKVEVPEAS